MSYRFLAIVSAASLAGLFALAALSTAQEPAQTRDTTKLATRLNDKHVLFRAMIEKEPDVTAHDIEAGRLVAVGGSEQGAENPACMQCHGIEGAGDRGVAFPRLAQLPAWYMYKQLRDYASGARPNNVMTPIAQRMTDAEMRSVSKYYAVVDAPYPPLEEVADTQLLQWGGQLAAVGSVEKGIPACTNCHGSIGFGVPPSVPYLAGQHEEYMELQLKLWKEGVRENDPLNVMAAIATKMSEEDMRAVSMYYSRVRPLEPRTAELAGGAAARGGALAEAKTVPERPATNPLNQPRYRDYPQWKDLDLLPRGNADGGG